MSDFIVVGVVVLLLGAIIIYVAKEKKGKKCIGCPYSVSCASSGKKSNYSSKGCSDK